MSEEHINLDKLAAPFPADSIHWRVGATSGDKKTGIALAYVDARDVMQRLDEVVGRGNWQCEYPWSDTKRLVCRIGIKIGGEWVWKSNGCGDTQVEAEKGAFSDAFKRAGVLWGIAQYLYDLPNTWVELQPQGRSYAIKESAKAKLVKQLADWQKGIRGKDEQEPEEKKKEEMTIALLVSHLPNCRTLESLDKYMRDNSKFVKGLFDKEQKEVIAEFSKRKVEITELGGSSQAQR